MANKKIQQLQTKAEQLTRPGKKFSKMLDDANVLLGEGARKLVEDRTESTFEAHTDFLDSLPNIGKAADNFRNWLQNNAYDPNGESTYKVREAYNQWTAQLTKARQSKVKRGAVQSHIESSVMAQRTLLLYTEVNRLANMSWTKQKRNIKAKERIKKIQTGEAASEAGQQAGGEIDRKVTQQFANDLQKMYVIIKAINWADITGKQINQTANFDDLISIVDAFTSDKDVQNDWFKIKETDIDILAGNAKQKLKIEVLPSKKIQDAEKKMGSMLRQVWDQRLYKIAELDGWKDIDWTKTEGSKSLEGGIVEQLTQKAAGKTVKKYKSKSKTTLKPKRKKTTSTATKKAKKVQRRYKSAKLPKAAAAPLMSRKESGRPERQQELLKLQRVINKRLPAEVRRNMGRPALINRTGRFSNSVELLRMQENASGALSGDYTYQLSPYETFENKGVRRWSTGYNPKDLITKSIRNLAEQYTTQKFSYLRRT